MRAIKVGLHDADAWFKAVNTDDLALRAQALAAYTLRSTSPESPRSTFRSRAREQLRKLGQDARAAAPDLVVLLKHPERAHPYYVISALRAIGDSSHINEIKPFLKHSNEQVRQEATEAINALIKRSSASKAGNVPI